MPVRIQTPETKQPGDASPAIQPQDRARARRIRRWVLPLALISLLLHGLAILLVLLMPKGPPDRAESASLDSARAQSQQELAIELQPNEPTSAPPPPRQLQAQADDAPAPPPAAPPPMPEPPKPVEPEPPPPPPPPVPPQPQPVPLPVPMPPPASAPEPSPLPPPPPASPSPTKPAPPKPPPPKPAPPSFAWPDLPQPRPPSPRPPAPRPAPQAPVSNDFFVPPTRPAPTRQAERGGKQPLLLGIGPVENYKQAPPRRNPNDADAQIQVTGAQVGSDWQRLLHEWWIEHRRYPDEAARRGEQGETVIRFRIDRSGHTSGAQILSGSGSQWLDLQSMATWNNARLPPFPSNTPENEATITVTIDYILLH